MRNSSKFEIPQRDSLVFKRYWNAFYSDLSTRRNFSQSNILQLEILCDLYTEYHEIRDIIKRDGMAYTTHGDRHGTQVKTHPLLIEKRNIMSEIRQYTRLLGIIMERYETEEEKPEEDDEDWAL